jgi:transposase
MYGSVRSQEQAMRYLLGHGMTSIEVGERLHVNPSTVRDWKRFYLMFGCTPAVARKRRKKGKHRLYNRKFSPGMKIRLMEIVRTRPHLYLHEIQQRFGETTGVYSSHSAIWKVLHELRWSLQQAQFAAAQRDEVARAEHLATLRDVTDDPKQFVFVDETSKDPDDVLRRRAWQPVNNPQHLSRYFTDGSIYSYTMIAAADIEGYVAEACELVRRKRGPDDADEDAGTIDAERFVHWVEYSLVPTLGNYLRGEPRSIVVMDNASIHMDVRVHELIADAGALLIY